MQIITSAVKSINVHPESNHANLNTKLNDITTRVTIFENIVDGAEVMAVNLNALCRVNLHGCNTIAPTSGRATCNVDIPCDEPTVSDAPTFSTPREPSRFPLVNLNGTFSSPRLSS